MRASFDRLTGGSLRRANVTGGGLSIDRDAHGPAASSLGLELETNRLLQFFGRYPQVAVGDFGVVQFRCASRREHRDRAGRGEALHDAGEGQGEGRHASESE